VCYNKKERDLNKKGKSIATKKKISIAIKRISVLPTKKLQGTERGMK